MFKIIYDYNIIINGMLCEVTRYTDLALDRV